MKKILLPGLFIIALPVIFWANGAKEYKVTDLLPVDNFEKADTDKALKEKWRMFNDQNNGLESSIEMNAVETPGYSNSKYCLHLRWKMDAFGKKDPYAGITRTLASETKGLDLTGYYGVRFYAKGKGHFNVRLATPATMKEFNFHKTTDIVLYPDWQLFEIPFSKFAIRWGTFRSWDPSNVILLEWGVDGRVPLEGEMYIDDVSFYKVVEVEKPGKEQEKNDNVKQSSPANKASMEQVVGKRVAVVGVESQDIDKKVAKAMIDFIINAYVNDGSLKVVDRNSIEKILDEQAFQTKDFTDTAKMIQIGKIAGADFISIGSLSRVGGMYYLNIKLISVLTAEIIGSSIAMASDDTGFFMMTNEAVSKLFKK